MDTCGHFQSLLLDHLYEVLDEHEEGALQLHLEQCRGCQAALVKAHEYKLASLQGDLESLAEKLGKLPAQQEQELTKVAETANARQLNVLVLGPEVMQPGRKNDYIVRTTDLNGSPIASKIEAKLVD